MVEEIAQALGQGQDPLPHRDLRKHMVHEVSGRLRHAPGVARGAHTAPLAGVGDQEVMSAPPAAGAAEPVGQDPALEVLRRSRSTKRGMGSPSGSASGTRASQVYKCS
jgi:hypothetical protein